MTLEEFETRLQTIRAANGWRITLECCGIWIITIYDKETGDMLASTGSTGLEGVLIALSYPLDDPIWSTEKEA